MEGDIKKRIKFSKSHGKLIIDKSLKDDDVGEGFLLVSLNSYYKLEPVPTADLFYGKMTNENPQRSLTFSSITDENFFRSRFCYARLGRPEMRPYGGSEDYTI